MRVLDPLSPQSPAVCRATSAALQVAGPLRTTHGSRTTLLLQLYRTYTDTAERVTPRYVYTYDEGTDVPGTIGPVITIVTKGPSVLC